VDYTPVRTVSLVRIPLLAISRGDPA
jgi:hypothetical protein